MTIWYTAVGCRPRAKAHDDAQKHPVVPVGWRIAEQDRSGEWVRSTEVRPDPYPEVWYMRGWLTDAVPGPVPEPPSDDLDAAVLLVFHAILDALRKR